MSPKLGVFLILLLKISFLSLRDCNKPTNYKYLSKLWD
jgi:hypothetical protein